VEEIDLKAKTVRVRRKLEGRHEMVAAPLPAMIAVLREINTPRYPSVPRRLMAEEAPIVLWDNKVMQLNETTIGLKGSATQVRKIFSPERAKGEIITKNGDRPEETARLLIEKMIDKDLLSL
jgi:electron transfer flavoprotein beta subunit